MDAHASQSATLVETHPKDWVTIAAAEGRYYRLEGWVSKILPASRDLFIYLPRQYLADATRSFPLLLMHDGQNLFDGNLSYVKDSTWCVGSTADVEIAANQVAPLIIAGIANTGVERMAEYTPTPDLRLGGGKGPLYAQMLVEEILPLLASRYRVLAGPERTGIAGSSLGGLISLAIGLRYPNRFGNVGVISPSLWWDDRTIVKDVRSLMERLPLRIWMDMGTAEGLRHVRDADLLAHLLRARGWKQGFDLNYRLYPEAAHNEQAWAKRFADVLRFLFPPN